MPHLPSGRIAALSSDDHLGPGFGYGCGVIPIAFPTCWIGFTAVPRPGYVLPMPQRPMLTTRDHVDLSRVSSALCHR
ncbi:hypothetical protein GCM10027271_38470 [Saccharopolyspora gloriosae]